MATVTIALEWRFQLGFRDQGGVVTDVRDRSRTIQMDACHARQALQIRLEVRLIRGFEAIAQRNLEDDGAGRCRPRDCAI